MTKFHVRNGDIVKVITGSAKGYEGVVTQIITAKSQVVVQGAKEITKATKARQGVEGGLVKKDGPIHISNVKLVERKQKEAKA